MYKNIAAIIAIVVTLLVMAGAASGESLWPEDKTKSMYVDDKAMAVGDLVTIIIVEASASSQEASTEAEKESSLSAGPGLGPLLEKIPMFKYSGGDSMSGSGNTTRTSTFTAKMTAKITKVNENGTMEIEGIRDVRTNKETEELKLTGTIRQQDIAPDNTILSTYIADAKIAHIGSGPIGSRQKEGLISKIFKILF